MEVVNVKNVIIKYIPEHIVVETYVLSNNSKATETTLQTNTKHKSNSNPNRTNEALDELYYISMDESLNPDSDGENNFEADSSIKEFTEEEYLEVDDDVQEMFIESADDIENAEFVEMESHGPNEQQKKKEKGSMQWLRDWFFDHLDVRLRVFDNFMVSYNFVLNLFQNPYPTEKEKESFCMLTNKTLLQVTITLEVKLIALIILLYIYTDKQLVH